jgi:hypothetical protein
MNKSQPKNGNVSNRRNGPNNRRKAPKSQIPKNPPVEKAPAAQARIMRNTAATYSCRPNGDVKIKHREYVMDVFGTLAFSTVSLPINPGRIVMFPWLAGLANRYESYQFDKLGFQFITSSPTSSSGTIALAVDYDALDVAPKSKGQMMGNVETVSASTWQMVTHWSKSSNLHKQKSYYVRSTSAVQGDLRMTDVGSLIIGVDGHSNTTTAIGSLFVEYEISLFTPNLEDLGIGSSVSQVRTGTSNAAPFGTFARGDSFFVLESHSGTTTSVTTFTFQQPWEGVASFDVTGTGLSGSILISGTAISGVPNEGGGATELVQLVRVQALAGQTLICTLGNTTVTAGNVYFMQGEAYA